MDLHHPITREFPHQLETIKQLKSTNDHFRKAFSEYHHLDDAVYRIEEEIDFATDQEIEELKLRRARLKDWLHHAIHQAQPSAAPKPVEGAELHHPILHELPKQADTIRHLRGTNEQFRKSFDEYHRLDDAIYRIEEEIDFASDQEMEILKLERARLKDWIFHAVTHTEAIK